MIEHKKWCSLDIVKECRHRINPFSKIIDKNDNITVPPTEVGLHCMESMPHLEKGSVETMGLSGAGWVRAFF
jgi:hypothetical protein